MRISWEIQVSATATLTTFLFQSIGFTYVFSSRWLYSFGLVVRSLVEPLGQY